MHQERRERYDVARVAVDFLPWAQAFGVHDLRGLHVVGRWEKPVPVRTPDHFEAVAAHGRERNPEDEVVERALVGAPILVRRRAVVATRNGEVVGHDVDARLR